MKKKAIVALLVFVFAMCPFFSVMAQAASFAPTQAGNTGDYVYISISDDDKYATSPVDGTPMAYVAVPYSEVEAISLADYGMERFYYDADGDGAYETTLMQLFIYTMETYYGAGSWANVTVVGASGSSYLQYGFWGHDENLTYYVNGAYPLEHEGWGATSDHIVLSPGDFCDISMYSDWSFWIDEYAGYHYFRDGSGAITHHYEAEAGAPLAVSLGRAWGNLDIGGATVLADERAGYKVYYGTAYDDPMGEVALDANGKADITFSQAGNYVVWADGAGGMYDPDAIVSAPAFATVTVAGGVPANAAPVLKAGVQPVEAQVELNTAYEFKGLKAGKIFEDAEGEKLSYYYETSTDGENWTAKKMLEPDLFGGAEYCLPQTELGTFQYRVYAYDGTSYSNDFWLVTLNVVNPSETTYDVTFYVGQDAIGGAGKNPVIKVYPTTGYDANQQDTYNDGQEITLQGGAVDAKGYRVYTASIPGGKYSYRAYGYDNASGEYTNFLGGMSIRIPVAQNVDGTGGSQSDVYLRVNNVYTTTKKNANDYFTAQDYYPQVSCPYYECNATSGDPYVSGNNTIYPYMLYAGGNACLYNMYVHPTESAQSPGYTWCFGSSVNATVATGNTVMTRSISMAAAITSNITAPTGAAVELYWQRNNFHNEQWECAGQADNGDGTTTWSYIVPKSNSNFTYRVSMAGYVTESGWMSLGSESVAAINVTMKYDASYVRTHDNSLLGTQTIKRDEADIMTNVSNTSAKNLGLGETFRLRNYRIWEIINGDAGNIMLEPDFNIQVLSGGECISIVDSDEGYSRNNWVDITGVAQGTAVLAVSYDAINVNGNTSHGGLFPATSPERTAIIVFHVGNGGTVISSLANSAGNLWNYNYDTFYFTEDSGRVTFGAEGLQNVEYAFVTTDSGLASAMSAFEAAAATEGSYSIPVTQGGTLVLALTGADGAVSYQCVRVVKVRTTVTNTTNPDQPLAAGDEGTITFEGLYRSIFKMAGIFNPGVLQVRYTDNFGTVVSANVSQYQVLDSVVLKFKVPAALAEGEEYILSGGFVNLASMFAYANPWEFLYIMSDEGTGTNFNAVNVTGSHSALPEIKLIANAVVGDVNGDGFADAADALLIVGHYTGSGDVQLTEQQLNLADVNGDGFVDALDALSILQQMIV